MIINWTKNFLLCRDRRFLRCSKIIIVPLGIWAPLFTRPYSSFSPDSGSQEKTTHLAEEGREGGWLCFSHVCSASQNVFPGNANQSVSPSFKDYFQSSVGVTMLTYHLLLQKKVEEFHKLGSCLF